MNGNGTGMAMTNKIGRSLKALTLGAGLVIFCGFASSSVVHAVSDFEQPKHVEYPDYPPAPAQQSWEEVEEKNIGCISCHTETDEKTMHESPAVAIGCVDCHGGHNDVLRPANSNQGDLEYDLAMKKAHVKPTMPETWHFPSSANPKASYTLLNSEAREYVRFVNPSDYRVVNDACGNCHAPIIAKAKRSLMSTGAFLWGGAAYNNGILPFKKYIVGEVYTDDGEDAMIKALGEVSQQSIDSNNLRPSMLPLPTWEVIPPADIFRVFERGGRNIVSVFPEIGIPNSLGLIQRLEEPGRPDIRQSNRGPGTGLRVAIPVLNIHKTRLNDPFMWFMGTSDNPGDYRTSGCGGCHIIYANDRDKFNSGPYAKYGNRGKSFSKDPTIPKDQRGHPIEHKFTRAIPTSQCMICHHHQPNIFLNTYVGTTMWDYESDADKMWPEEQKYPTAAEMHEVFERNPEGAAPRGKWADPEFLAEVYTNNDKLDNTQFADYHGHGWNWRYIFKKDRKGNLLDAEGDIVEPDDPEKFQKAVHMKSIHLEKGMHCVDCHFEQDVHGDGHLYGEVAAAIEIRCKDCHGTADELPTLFTSGPSAKPPHGGSLEYDFTPFGKRRFRWEGDKLIQASMVEPDLEWEMSLVKNTVNPGHPEYNEKAARAKTVSNDTSSMNWGPGVSKENRAHQDEKMECFTCHLSWTTSCAGCHLPIEANWKTDTHHFQGKTTRNYATYNPQVARDQMFQLGINASVKGNTIAPIRSTSALILSSTNINREKIYLQQPPIAASGFSSQAFAPHFPHTVRKTETKTCTDCHLSEDNDNNAIMAQLLLQGTNFVNFVGYYTWVGGESSFQAVNVTEWDEPQAVIGSFLHKNAYPDYYQKHLDRNRELKETHVEYSGEVGCLQMRGEYLYVAEGSDGMTVYDIASIANKGISDRILSAPFGPWGNDTNIASPNATCVALPTNQSIAPSRNQGDLMRITNEEQPFHPIYNYAFITDSVDGLIVTDVNTFNNVEPRDNNVTRALTWNEGGVLTGARHITIAGSMFYITTPSGVVVLDMKDPLQPKHVGTIEMEDARATALQFRYLFVTTSKGLEVVDVTHPQKPRKTGSVIELADAHRVYLARTYAYVAAGKDGLVIVDATNPENLTVHQKFTANGQLNDARDVIVASTNATAYAYVADGINGLKVVHLTAPDKQPRFYGFSPEPVPELIAWKQTNSPATALSKGLDRDRGVDETGGQIAIFGRIGSRPFTLKEQQKLYLNEKGEPWYVTDEVRQQDFIETKPDKDKSASLTSQ